MHRHLYKLVSNDRLPEVMANGFQPRAGNHNGNPYSARVWLFTDINRAYLEAWRAIHRIPHQGIPNFPFGFVTNEIAWRWYGDRWYAVQTNLFSIVTIAADSIRCFPDDVHHGMTRKHRRAVVWTPEPVSPSAILSVDKLDKSRFASEEYRDFARKQKGHRQPILTAGRGDKLLQRIRPKPLTKPKRYRRRLVLPRPKNS